MAPRVWTALALVAGICIGFGGSEAYRKLSIVQHAVVVVAPEPVKRVLAPQAMAGDSLGNGMAIALGWSKPDRRNAARDGAFTRELAAQLARLPKDIVIGVSMGTNDGNDTKVADLRAPIAAALKVAAERNQTLVWYGPPSFALPWGKNAIAISAQIEATLRDTPHRFVRTHETKFGPGLRAGDRIHFTITRGYCALYETGGLTCPSTKTN